MSRALRKRYGRSKADVGGKNRSVRYSGNYKILMGYRDDNSERHPNGYYKILDQGAWS